MDALPPQFCFDVSSRGGGKGGGGGGGGAGGGGEGGGEEGKGGEARADGGWVGLPSTSSTYRRPTQVLGEQLSASTHHYSMQTDNVHNCIILHNFLLSISRQSPGLDNKNIANKIFE